MIDYCWTPFAVTIIRLGNYRIPVQSRRLIVARVNFCFFQYFRSFPPSFMKRKYRGNGALFPFWTF
ncbi:hypothetical protein SAMN05216417_10470 [Nitrosospira multiformis]|uniref:Uncharacterized protein n=1 Tax=Nitrosospira multiformis TaxID=1231 RepID=A0A1I7GB01_9PROT|nr:hypothetical protein SAMN05216417_10470 [Nitrosospira multiformis]